MSPLSEVRIGRCEALLLLLLLRVAHAAKNATK